MKNDLINQIKVNDVADALDILKAAGTEDLFEKGKWNVGDEKVYQGVTYYVAELNAKGSPKWRKKKGEGKPSGGGSAKTQSSKTDKTSTTNKSSKWKIGDTKDYKGVTWVCSGFNDKGGVKWRKAKGQTTATKSDDKKTATDSTNSDSKKTASKNNEGGVYSHDINGVTVNVSKNKDGSYTLEANGKKVKSDDPSFFKDKLLPRVKKALAKELGIVAQKSTKTTKTNKSFEDVTKEYVNAFGNEGYSKTKASKELTNKYVNTLSDDSKTRSTIRKVLSAELKNERYGTTKRSMEEITKTINASLSRFSSLAEADKYMRDYISKRIKSGKEEIGWTDKDLKGAEVSMSVDGWFTLGDRHRGYEFNPKSGRMYTY